MSMKLAILGGVSIDFGTFEPCTMKEEPVLIQQKRAEVGQKVRFDPFKEITGFASEDHRNNPVTGIVVMVNEPHKWFSVEYGNPKMRTSFKFSQIGKDVLICGH